MIQQKKQPRHQVNLRLNPMMAICLSIILNCSWVSCSHKKEKVVGTVEYLKNIPDTGLSIQKIAAIKFSDSFYVRFFSDFEKDSVVVALPGTNFMIKQNSITTDKSLAFTGLVLAIPRTKENNFVIKISNVTFDINIPDKFFFIDVYYDKKNKKISINYSNKLVILS